MKLIDTFANGWDKVVGNADETGITAMQQPWKFPVFDSWYQRAVKLVKWSSIRWGPNKVKGHLKDAHLKMRYDEVYLDTQLTRLQVCFANGWYKKSGQAFVLAHKVKIYAAPPEELTKLHRNAIRLKRWAVMRWGEHVADNLFVIGVETKGKVKYDKV